MAKVSTTKCPKPLTRHILVFFTGLVGSLLPNSEQKNSLIESSEVAENSELIETEASTISPTSTNTIEPSQIPINTPEPTNTDALLPTETPTPSTLPTQLPMIIDASTILNSSVTEVERILGSPVAIYSIDNGEGRGNTVGGESREYDYGKHLFTYVDYDKNGIAKLIRFTTGITEEQYKLEDYPVLLQRFGFVITSPPDIEALIRYEWSNYSGFTISITQTVTKSDSYVALVENYITP